jgi:hypothetical protein
MKKPSTTRKKRLAKIRQAEDSLSWAIKAPEDYAEKENLPTEWFPLSLRYLVRMARNAA